jgi:THO complex subunit 5
MDLPIPDPDALLNNLVQLTVHDNAIKHESGPLFARLKAVNRTATAAVRASKQRTGEARLAMDQAHLQLQNLLYERRHLEREIEKCNRFA